MAKMITRTFIKTTVHVSSVSMNGKEVVLTPVGTFEATGDLSNDQAIRMAQKNYGRKAQYVVELEKSSTTYGMPVEDFLDHAIVISGEAADAESADAE